MSEKENVINFPEAVRVFINFLELVGDDHWLDLARRHEKNERKFLDLFGGMGSFNDLVISEYNGHKISKDKEPFANTWLYGLSTICCFLGRYEDVTGKEAVETFRTLGEDLKGFRCLDCGVAHVLPRNLTEFHYHHQTRNKIQEGIEKGKLGEIFLEEWNGFDEANVIAKYSKTLEENSINLVSAFDAKDSCSKCGGNDIVAYRWDWNGETFTPSPLNLELKNSKP